ncbi:MAG TPA: hypothetical protein VHP36_05705 [Chitinispirillaceae bacterium]|nr:hypothetical protein [Chitinispirillaceae bacterium]
MKIFYSASICVLLALIIMTLIIRSEPDKFYGIAETKETIINADEPVEVEKINVIQGQKVSIGDTLVILYQPELNIMINEIAHTLDEYRAQHKFQTSFSLSEMEKYKAEQAERVNEITAEIQELETQYEMNNKLVDELRSVKKVKRADNDSLNPILTQIRSLKRLLKSARQTPQVEISRLSRDLTRTEDPIVAQVLRYEQELALLNKRRNDLVKTSQINGIIGMVKFKNGEKVSPFDTILTLHMGFPSYVKGYIHEDLFSRISIGDSVLVHSVSNGKKNMMGRVMGVGSRIIEYPQRLWRQIDIPIWGREVIIKLPENNSLVLGQKVLISLLNKKFFFNCFANVKISTPTFADEISKTKNINASTSQITSITIDPTLSATPLEASGVTYFDDLKSFLIISDDTERKRPDLFLMDTTGRITLRTSIKGLDKINDMESVFYYKPNHLYILCSQSYNKNDKQPESRMLFVRSRRNGSSFEFEAGVNLFDLLLTAASETPSEKWADFIIKSDRDKTVDIEGMLVFKDTLLLGFKNPKLENRAVILSVTNFNSVLNTGKLSSHHVSIWRILPLYDTATGTFCGISDLTTHGDYLYGVSTGVSLKNGINEDVGLLWKYSPLSDSITIIRNFTGIKPEGITVFDNPPRFCIVFDNGTKNPSQFLIGKVSL